MEQQRAARAVVVVVALVAAVAVASPTSAAPSGGWPTSAIAGPGARPDPADPAASGSRYVAVGPTRLADTRKGPGEGNGLSGVFGPGESRDLTVAGVGGVPADATAVVVNVTVTGGSEQSDLRVWPAGEATPATSNLNWAAGETVPNLVTVGVGAGGAISIRNQSGTVHVIVDVQGVWAPTVPSVVDFYQPIDPERILDTRDPAGPGPLGRATRDLAVQQLRDGPDAPIPSSDDARAVVVNVTVTGGTEASDLRLWPAPATGTTPAPSTSNLNWAAGDTRANLAIVPVGEDGEIRMWNRFGDVHVVIDLVGYVTPWAYGQFEAVTPERLWDTRRADSPLTGAFGPGESRDVAVTAPGGGVALDSPVPAGATAVVLNLTVTAGTAASDLRVWPEGLATPGVSNLNWPAGATRPNQAIVPIGDDGEIRVRNQSGHVHVIGDVVGYVVEDRPPTGEWLDVSLPADVGNIELTAVDCFAEACFAAGTDWDAGGDSAGFLWDGDTWERVPMPGGWTHRPGSEVTRDNLRPASIACADVDNCLLQRTWEYDDDEYQDISGWDGETWTRYEWPASDAIGAWLELPWGETEATYCDAATDQCVAHGLEVLTLYWDAASRSWRYGGGYDDLPSEFLDPAPPDGARGDYSGVDVGRARYNIFRQGSGACAAVDRCIGTLSRVVRLSFRFLTFGPFEVRWDGERWHPLPTPTWGESAFWSSDDALASHPASCDDSGCLVVGPRSYSSADGYRSHAFWYTWPEE